MRRLGAVLVGLVALSGLVAITSTAVADPALAGRACSGSSCAVVRPGGGPDATRRGHAVRLYYQVEVIGLTAVNSLDVAGNNHLHLTGTVTVDGAAPAPGSVTKRGASVHIVLPRNVVADADNFYMVAVTSTVDQTARTDMSSLATVSVTAPGAAPAMAHTSQTVPLDRPAVYVWSHPTFTVRAGHHRQMDAIFANQATVKTHTATLWITLPAYTRLSSKWGVMYDNRRMHCTGSVRHYRCAITGMHGYAGGVMIDVRATKHAPHHYVGQVVLRGEPTAYDNGSNQNTASTRVRVKR